MPILENLTDEQRVAVTAPVDRPLLINAVAGSGKTEVIARRVVWLQRNGLRAQRIRVLTFSRAGAAAIGARLEHWCQIAEVPIPRARTFHSFCLRAYGAGARPNLVSETHLPARLRTGTWLDGRKFNMELVLRYDQILDRAEPASPDRAAPAFRLHDYGRMLEIIRNGHPDLSRVVTTPKDLSGPGIPERLALPDQGVDLPARSVEQVYAAYQRALDETGRIDFPEMVVRAIRRLESDRDALCELHDRIDHLVVDEFQDTSLAQERLMRLVVRPDAGFTVVGDDDQTIYSFSGSNPRNILEFAARNESEDRRPTVRAPLQVNFRSSAPILRAAGNVIRGNEKRVAKDLRPLDPAQYNDFGTDAARLMDVTTLEAVAKAIADQVEEWISEEAFRPEEIAVLSRMNPSAAPERAVLDNVRALLEEREIPVAKRRDLPAHRWDVMRFLGRFLDDHGTETVDLLDNLLEAHPGSLSGGASSFLEAEIERARVTGVPNIRSLYREMGDDNFGSDSPILSKRGVVLKTIHQAKGEEYEAVVLAYLHDDLFPFPWASDLEEERRLLYVGLTRARRLLRIVGRPGSSFYNEVAAALGAAETPFLDRAESAPRTPIPTTEPPGETPWLGPEDVASYPIASRPAQRALLVLRCVSHMSECGLTTPLLVEKVALGTLSNAHRPRATMQAPHPRPMRSIGEFGCLQGLGISDEEIVSLVARFVRRGYLATIPGKEREFGRFELRLTEQGRLILDGHYPRLQIELPTIWASSGTGT